MKKIPILLLILLILIGCTSQPELENADSVVRFDESITATFEIPTGNESNENNEEKPHSYKQITVLPLNEEGEVQKTTPLLGYSLTPLNEFEEEIKVTSENYYRVNNVSIDEKDKLFWIAYYGYGYQELTAAGHQKQLNEEELTAEDTVADHTADNYYLATQELIWETQEINATFTIDLTAEKQSIMNLIANHSNKYPNFGGSVITIDQEDIDEQRTYTINDQNDTLHLFDVTIPEQLELISNDNKTIEVKLLGYADDLAISFNHHNRFVSEDTIEYTDIDNNRYITFGNSRLQHLGSKFHLEMDDSLLGTTISITTIDQADANKIIYGAQYEIADNESFTMNTIKSTVSEEKVNAQIEYVTSNKIYIRQVVAPDGYLVSEEIKEIRIPDGATKLSVTFVNQVEIIEEKDNNN